MATYQTPGVYREDLFLPPATVLRTGVPALLGYAEQGPVNTPQLLTLWPQFGQNFGLPVANHFLAHAVRGFFENGGPLCYVVRLDPTLLPAKALTKGLSVLAALDAIDLVCAPDIMRLRWSELTADTLLLPDPAEVELLQQALLDHCESTGTRLALLDALPCAGLDGIISQRETVQARNGALYYPWLRLSDGPVYPARVQVRDDCQFLLAGFVPPSGHVAGIYARTDQRIGVHKAPANEVIEGVLDLEIALTNAQQGQLNPLGINCLRTFPGRGIRVWGARTLSNETAWTYVNVRRIFLTAGRWIDRNMMGMVYEPHDARLWARIVRELTTYFTDLLRRGALMGNTPQEAFYIKCNAETNPPEVRDAGQVVTEIGLAPAAPSEFVVVRIIHGPSGVTIA